ncbi:MAG: efflux RND transporter periplasmic adaptor subunit [Ignavibacteriales bacterium]|nr:efflux RND transporter periplasmic adaptor subunit [Ignavibacteriales bacterium]
MPDSQQEKIQLYDYQLPDLGTIPGTPITFLQHVMKIVFFIFSLSFLTGLVIAFTITFDTTIDANGILEPKIVIPVRSNQTGIIQQINTSTGAIVQKGQIIARLDSLSFENQLIKIESEYQSKKYDYQKTIQVIDVQRQQEVELLLDAKAKLIRSKAQFRNSLLQYGFNAYDDSFSAHYKVGTHTGIDIALSDISSAEAVIRYHTSKIEEIDLNLLNIQKELSELKQLEKQITILNEVTRQLTIFSPVSGVVLTENVERLNGSLIREGDPLIEIGGLDYWRVNLFLNDQEIHEIKTGDLVSISIKALPFMKYGFFSGRVVSIASEPVSAEQTKFIGLFRVTIDIDSLSLNSVIRGKLRRGYNVEGKIKTGSGRIIDFIWKELKNSRASL